MVTLFSATACGSLVLIGHNNLKWSKNSRRLRIWGGEFPDFLPKQVENIKDSYARKLASRIERIPVNLSEGCVMSSCVKSKEQTEANPVVLLHGFDSSCLEWRYTLPMLEEAGLETWAVDILGWGFSDLERLPPCNVASKRDHLYQLWSTHIKRPMVLVGPSLGSAVAIDFSVKYPEAVHRLVLIDASVYAEGTGNLATLPKAAAYAGVYLLKSLPIRLYATSLAFNGLPIGTCIDWTNIGRLHCLLPWWEDAAVNFMISGGYNVMSQIEHVCADLLNFLERFLNRHAFVTPCHFLFALTVVSSNIILLCLIDNDWIRETSNIEFNLTSFILTLLLFGLAVVGV